MFTLKSLYRSLAVAGLIMITGFLDPVSGQSCSLPSVSSPASYNYASRQVTFSNVSLNSGGNSAQVNPGQTVNISFSWSSSQNGSYCSGCIVQLYVGINGHFTQCLTSGFNGYSASGSQNFNFTAPSTAGIYYITSTGTLHYSCQSVGTPQCGGSTLAVIRVGNPSQTASVAITGNTSFCPGNTATMSATVSGNFCTPSGITYQWYAGGDPYTLGTAISGATSSSYTTSTQGNYRVVATNACGGSVASSPFFVSQDNVAPVAIAKDVTIYLDANGSATLTPGMMDNGSSDNCGINTLTLSKTTFSCNNINQVSNGTLSGNLTCDNEFVAYLSTSATSLGTQIGSGTDWTQTYSLTSQTLTTGSDYYLHIKATDIGSIEALIGTFNVSGSFIFANGLQTMSTNPSYWTVANSFGGTNIGPVALGTNGMSPWGTRSGIASTAQWIWRNPTNTSGGETVYFTTKISFNAVYNDIILTATDYSNNSGFDIGRVTVVDNIAPTVVTQNVTLYLDANGNASTTAAAVNNGSYDNCGVASVTLSKTSFNCSNAGANTVVLTVTDESGNSATGNATVTVVDNSAPSISCGANITASSNITSGSASVSTGSVSAYIFNSTSYSYNFTDPVPSGATITGVTINATVYYPYNCCYAHNYMSINSSGIGGWSPGVTSGVQSGTVTSNTEPSGYNYGGTNTFTAYSWWNGITFKGATITFNYVLGGCSGQITVAAPTATDNCGIASLTNSFNNSANATDLYPVGSTTVIWTATDVNGNQNTCSQVITVNDNEAPDVLTQNVTIYLDANGAASTTASAVNNGSSDNCGIASMSLSKTSFDCSNVGNNSVTLTVTDIHSNSATGTATVTVVDNTAPTVNTQNVTIYLDANGAASTTASAVNNGSSDNCGVGSVALSKTSFDCSNVGNNAVTLTVTDVNGNTNTGTATVTVVDNSAPTITTQNVTIYLDANGAASTNAAAVNNGSSDNCGVASMSLSKTSFDCSNVGNNSVTLTVTDVNGNSATGSATVTVVDNAAPTVTTQNVTIYLDANGAASTTAAAVNNGSSDNCGVASISLSKTSFDCSNVGNNSVTLTVTDVNGNSATGSATVTVVDNSAPTVQTQNVTIYLDANGAASTTAGAIDNGSYDNCSVGSVSLSQTSFSCSEVGPNTVTLTVTDVNGNSATGNATVTVVDNIAPMVLTKPASVTLSGATASITASDVNDGSYDNCGVASVSVSPSTFNCGNIGANTVTLTVTDVNGNTSTNTATVTVNGYIPSCTLSATPSNNTYTGAAANQMFIGYGPQSMNLSCAATGGTGFSYSWSGSYLNSTSGSTNVFSPTAGGNYTIVCTVTNSNGCETTCSITICVLDIRSNNNANNQKVYLCHVPNGNSNNPQTLSISVSAVPSHLNNHGGDKLGQCSQTCGSLKNEPVGELYEVGEEIHLIVYPNPSSSIFKITLESESDELITVTLFDATGKLIKEIEGGHSFEEMHLDASGLAPGVYMAVVKQGDLLKTVKLTKTE